MGTMGDAQWMLMIIIRRAESLQTDRSSASASVRMPSSWLLLCLTNMMKQKLWFTIFKSKKQRFYTISSMEWASPKFLSTQKILYKFVHQGQNTGRFGWSKRVLSRWSLSFRRFHRLLTTLTTLGSMMTGLWQEPRAESWSCLRILKSSSTLILRLTPVASARGSLVKMVKHSLQWMYHWLSLTLKDSS